MCMALLEAGQKPCHGPATTPHHKRLDCQIFRHQAKDQAHGESQLDENEESIRLLSALTRQRETQNGERLL